MGTQPNQQEEVGSDVGTLMLNQISPYQLTQVMPELEEGEIPQGKYTPISDTPMEEFTDHQFQMERNLTDHQYRIQGNFTPPYAQEFQQYFLKTEDIGQQGPQQPKKYTATIHPMHQRRPEEPRQEEAETHQIQQQPFLRSNTRLY